jgi:hypothetical protein
MNLRQQVFALFDENQHGVAPSPFELFQWSDETCKAILEIDSRNLSSLVYEANRNPSRALVAKIIAKIISTDDFEAWWDLLELDDNRCDRIASGSEESISAFSKEQYLDGLEPLCCTSELGDQRINCTAIYCYDIQEYQFIFGENNDTVRFAVLRELVWRAGTGVSSTNVGNIPFSLRVNGYDCNSFINPCWTASEVFELTQYFARCCIYFSYGSVLSFYETEHEKYHHWSKPSEEFVGKLQSENVLRDCDLMPVGIDLADYYESGNLSIFGDFNFLGIPSVFFISQGEYCLLINRTLESAKAEPALLCIEDDQIIIKDLGEARSMGLLSDAFSNAEDGLISLFRASKIEAYVQVQDWLQYQLSSVTQESGLNELESAKKAVALAHQAFQVLDDLYDHPNKGYTER